MAEWAGVFVLVGLSLFWAATNYSQAVGTGRAHEHVRTLYVFLPAKWSPADGVAVVLPRNDAVRLEFFPSSAAAATQRLSC